MPCFQEPITVPGSLQNLPGKGIGHFFGAMRVDAFRPADEFKSHMDEWIRTFRNSKRVNENQQVIIPGEPEMLIQRERLKNGVPLLNKVIEDIKEISSKTGILIEI